MVDYIAQHHHVNTNNYIDMTRQLYMGFGWGELPDPAGEHVQGTLTTRVNHGRWLIDCPTCRAAQFAEFSSLFFMCVECANRDNDGKWYAVIIPSNYEEIESALLARTMGINPAHSPTRNWDPSETVEDLLKENELYGS